MVDNLDTSNVSLRDCVVVDGDNGNEHIDILVTYKKNSLNMITEFAPFDDSTMVEVRDWDGVDGDDFDGDSPADNDQAPFWLENITSTNRTIGGTSYSPSIPLKSYLMSLGSQILIVEHQITKRNHSIRLTASMLRDLKARIRVQVRDWDPRIHCRT